jgi:hypothetical protein
MKVGKTSGSGQPTRRHSVQGSGGRWRLSRDYFLVQVVRIIHAVFRLSYYQRCITSSPSPTGSSNPLAYRSKISVVILNAESASNPAAVRSLILRLSSEMSVLRYTMTTWAPPASTIVLYSSRDARKAKDRSTTTSFWPPWRISCSRTFSSSLASSWYWLYFDAG